MTLTDKMTDDHQEGKPWGTGEEERRRERGSRRPMSVNFNLVSSRNEVRALEEVREQHSFIPSVRQGWRCLPCRVICRSGCCMCM